MSGLEKAKGREEWLRDGGRYVPMASTWLEGYRWEDEDTYSPPQNKTYSTAWESPPEEKASYGTAEDFLELALARSYEKMRK